MAKDDTSLVSQAYAAYIMGGQDALKAWHDALSDDRKLAYRSEMDDLMADIIDAFRPVAAAFREVADNLPLLFKE